MAKRKSSSNRISGLRMGVEITDLKQADQALQKARDEFEKKIEERTVDLQAEIAGHKRTEEALRVSEARFRSLFENSLDGVMLTSTDGSVLAANKEMCRLTGMTEEEIIQAGREGLSVNDSSLQAALEERERTGCFRGELMYRRKDRSDILVEISSGVFKDSDGRVLTSTIVRDITDRKRMEEELASSNRKITDILESIQDGFFTLNHEWRFTYVNRRAAVNVGLQPEDIVGETLWEKFPQILGTSHEASYRRAMEAKEVQRFEVRGVLTGQWYNITAYPSDEGISVYWQNISDRKRAEEALRQARDELEQRVAERTASVVRLAAAVESAAESILITDSSWHIEYANPAFCSITGYTAGEVIGHEIGLLRAENEDPSAYDRKRQEAIAGKPCASRFMIRRKDGTAFPADSVLSPVKDASGATRNFVLIWRDMSEQARLEEQLRQSHKMEAIGALAGGIAHDFNNMLAIIIGNAELALDDIDEEELRGNLGQILKAAKRSRDLVKQILTFSRRNGIKGKPMKMVPLLKETYDLLRASLPSTIHMNLHLRTKSDTILADPSLVQQVVVNLANNAAYAMGEAGGVLTIGLSSVTLGSDSLPDDNMRPGRYVKLTVKDTGTGIAPEIQSRIFEPFFTTKEQGQGTGMGLSVVYGIVKGYNGMIEVESELGRGSNFTVLLRQADAFPAIEEEQEEDFPSSGNEHILFVDDEPAVVGMTKTMLERMGYRVTALTECSEALRAFAGNPDSFDLIITDQTMPDMTGIALAKKVLAVKNDMPIIICTGYSEAVSPEIANEVGIRECVMKPVTKKEMSQAIRKVLGQGEQVK